VKVAWAPIVGAVTLSTLTFVGAVTASALADGSDSTSTPYVETSYLAEATAIIDDQWATIKATRGGCTDSDQPQLTDTVAVVTMPRTQAEVNAHATPRFDITVVRFTTFDAAYAGSKAGTLRVVGYCK
jgi:hypothetical protein